jgi:hypothetical protein
MTTHACQGYQVCARSHTFRLLSIIPLGKLLRGYSGTQNSLAPFGVGGKPNQSFVLISAQLSPGMTVNLRQIPV